MNTDGPPGVFSWFWIGKLIVWIILAVLSIELAVLPTNQPLPLDEWALYPVKLLMSLHP